MGKIKPGFLFTGRLGKLSAYTRRGSDEIIVRTKGGPTKSAIKNSPRFVKTRQINKEFGGRSHTSSWIMMGLFPHKALADYNIAGDLNKVLKHIQSADHESVMGQRHVLISKSPRTLDGFQLNKKNNFDALVRSPLSCSLDRSTGSARIEIPALLPGINFFAPAWHPLYCISATVALLPDVFYTEREVYAAVAGYTQMNSRNVKTEWIPAAKGTDARVLEVSLDLAVPESYFSLMLSVGICFGTLTGVDTVEQVKYAGAAKIVMVG